MFGYRFGFRIGAQSGGSRRRSGPRRIRTIRTWVQVRRHHRRSSRRPCRIHSLTWARLPCGNPSTRFVTHLWVTDRSFLVVTPLMPIIGHRHLCYHLECLCPTRRPPPSRACWRTYRRRKGRSWCAIRHRLHRQLHPRPRSPCRIPRFRRLRRSPARPKVRPRVASGCPTSTDGPTASPPSDSRPGSTSCTSRCFARTATSSAEERSRRNLGTAMRSMFATLASVVVSFRSIAAHLGPNRVNRAGTAGTKPRDTSALGTSVRSFDARADYEPPIVVESTDSTVFRFARAFVRIARDTSQRTCSQAAGRFVPF